MIFRTSSWHYRLVEWTYGHRYFWKKDLAWDNNDRLPSFTFVRRNISLCKYFWSIVLAIVAIPWSLAWKVAGENIKAVMVIGGFELGEGSFLAFLLYRSSGWLGILIGYSIPAIIIGLMILFVYLSEKISWSWPELKQPRPHKLPKVKGPSLVKEYMMAKKQKVCPIIQWDET